MRPLEAAFADVLAALRPMVQAELAQAVAREESVEAVLARLQREFLQG
jgi:hypothetical protein